MRRIGLAAEGVTLDFASAEALARAVAERQAPDAMLLAWFDRDGGRESPEIPECQRKPGWLAYAESHGGDLTVDVNRGAYIFVFASGTPG